MARAESIVKARQAAQRAVELGPNYAETHVALAELSYRADANMLNAEREFVRAVELDGRSAYARQRYAAFLHEQRQFDHALEQLRIAAIYLSDRVVVMAAKSESLRFVRPRCADRRRPQS